VAFNPMAMGGRTVLVTGASSGIGRETAILLSQLEARVVLAGRDRDRLQAALEALEGSGHSAESFDLSAGDGIPAWIKGIVGRTGPLDGVVHSAGVIELAPVRTLDCGQIDRIMNVNLDAALMLARGFRQKGCHGAQASMVTISSVAALRAQPGLAAYAASKAALLGMTRSLALELARDGIRVNCVAAGLVASEMARELDQNSAEGTDRERNAHPLGLGKPRDIANAIAFLLSDAARWITGSTMAVDGGYSA
jgi:NAD(P)-dependent dehydrogenase (short-subunit alcohol dehydrogenase family)